MIYNIVKTDDFLLCVSEKEIKEGDKVVIQDVINGYKTLVVTLSDIVAWDYNAQYNIKKPLNTVAYFPLSDKQLDLPLLPKWEDGAIEKAEAYFQTRQLGSFIFSKTLFEVVEHQIIGAYVNGYRSALEEHGIKIYPKQFKVYDAGSNDVLAVEINGVLQGEYIF